jgi:molecular chaperone IbpA
LENGFLTVELARELPDEMKPRRIAIATGNEPLEEKQAA